ncbi:MAG TPA: amidohydrolase family protein [Bryobacteraceae bacterium]|nr:amidohydrolase family protein [Bryobacteraceae bacterium]
MQTPWGDFNVADAHVHFFSRRFFEILAAQSKKKVEEVAAILGWQLPPEDPGELARFWSAELDRHGVARAALIASVPGDEESVAAALDVCPDRFFGYFMLNPIQHDAVERVRKAFTRGLDAVCLFPAMHRYSINDSQVVAVLDEVSAQNGHAVFVHCGVLTVGVRRRLGLPSPFDMRYSNPIDLHPVALHYPELNFIIPHFGAGYLREALMLADLCPNVYLDTSSSNSWRRYLGLDLKSVFRRALDGAGPERLLFGTDSSYFPRGWNYEVFEEQARALVDLGVSGNDTSRIFSDNLPRILAK